MLYANQPCHCLALVLEREEKSDSFRLVDFVYFVAKSFRFLASSSSLLRKESFDSKKSIALQFGLLLVFVYAIAKRRL